jgi:hypothetical protein
MSLDPKQFEEWKRLAEEATPGPWEHDGDALSWDEEQGYASEHVVTSVGEWRQQSPDTGAAMAQQARDAHFIAAAREAVPALIAEVERLQRAQGEVVRCLLYVTCPHCGESYGTPPGDCELVDHVEAHQALVAADGRELEAKG